MTPKVAIRVDCALQIGSGHYVRCRTLADALKSNGFEVVLLCRHMPESCTADLRRAGFGVEDLSSFSSPRRPLPVGYCPPFHAPWLGVSALEDAEACLLACQKYGSFDWFVLDHYALDVLWEHKTAPLRKHLLVIDDLADRQHDCDILLDQNCYIGADKRYNGLVPPSCISLLGAKYALLREQFSAERALSTQRCGPLKKLLVFMSGSDNENYTGLVLDTLVSITDVHVEHVEVVTGGLNPHIPALRRLCADHGWELAVDVKNMAERMRRADAAIGAVGTTNLERFCLGLPTFALSIAHNQQKMLEDCTEQKLLCTLSEGESLKTGLRNFLKNDALRSEISSNCRAMVDGLGVSRLVSAMKNRRQTPCPTEGT